jgi:Protein of unknown function (DUF3489)
MGLPAVRRVSRQPENQMSESKTNKPKNAESVSTRDVSVEREVDNLTLLSKHLMIIEMLRRPDGTSIVELSEATGWKPNSVRGAISGAIRRKRLMKATSALVNGVRTYRITG